MQITLSVSNQGSKLSQTHNILCILLLLGDIVGLVLSLSLTFWTNWDKNLNTVDLFVNLLFCLLVITGLYLADTYHPDNQISGLRAPARILITNLVVGCIFFVILHIIENGEKLALWKWQILLPSLGILTIWTICLRIWAAKWARSQAQNSRWLIVGANKETIEFGKTFLQHNSLGRLVILATPDQNTHKLANNHRICVTNLYDLPQWTQQAWSGVVVATPTELSDIQVQQLMQLRLAGVPIYGIPDICENLWYKLPSSLLQDNWLVFSSGYHLTSSSISQKIKRVTDIILASLLFLGLFPLMLLTALAIKLDSPGSFFYSQVRTGLKGQTFRVYKFRSMYQDAEKRGVQWANEDDPRITRVGRWLRLLRIDELPQIFNVLSGEMSLIGPRPERPEFDIKLRQEIPYYDLRYIVKPGITGWAQVMYPYGASVEDAYEKLAYDLYYIKNYSQFLDLAIAFKTIRVVLLGKGR
ncbi:sugar transferase [Anabaena sp. UHCC 0399]|uniref:sugar transferase n=1 Tax=Anabaena sp. UHCC 0399 TaxID=3110238 RepID=UPI002B211C03|nr:sugar transferase [Anabaena sp. UHCC 0399]MEA5566425.1 sugar transferase [Anabaena sp. UHCC 0399]